MIYVALQLNQTPAIIEEVTGLYLDDAQELLDDLDDLIRDLIVPETKYLTVISEHLFRDYSLASWRIVALNGEEEIFRMDFTPRLPEPPAVEEPARRVSRFDREDVI